MSLTTYITKDFYYSVVLKSLGYKLIFFEQTSRGLFEFTFDITQAEANSILTQFLNDDIQVKAKSFVEAINSLKSIIHSNE